MKDGIQLNEATWKEDEAELRRRAAFDLSCPAESLQLTVLSEGGEYNTAGSVGVTGCDKKATYVTTRTREWVLNSDAGPAK